MSTFLCISSYYKGADFMRQCKTLGNKVILITSKNLENEEWPWDSIDEVYYMDEKTPYQWNVDHLIAGVAYLFKSQIIDRVIALDDFDVEKGALLRETFRIPGMGQTTHRYFRDKLAMRQKAKELALNAPSFTAIFNDKLINNFADTTTAPWVLKPRSEASAVGISKLFSKDDLWHKIHELGETRHRFLLEQFKPGDVFHVDSLVYEGKVIFTSCSKYLAPPLSVSQEGGIFRTATLNPTEKDFKQLEKLNRKLLEKFGLQYGATHSEFIKCYEDGKWYFLETSARVGGAYIPDMVEAATGINLWKEWANIEHALLNNKAYQLPPTKNEFGGLLISLSHTQHPDLSFIDDEIFKRQLKKDYHVGMLLSDKSQNKVLSALDNYAQMVQEKFMSILPPSDKPTS